MKGLAAAVICLGMCSLVAGCGGGGSGSTGGGATGNPPVTAVTLSATSLSFSAGAGLSAASQTVTLTNTGNTAVAVSSVAVSGTNASLFGESTSCGTTLAVNGTCTAAVGFSPAASGTFTGTLTFATAAGNEAVALTGSGLVQAPVGSTADCSVSGGSCGTGLFGGYGSVPGGLATDPVAAGYFHGYADPAERKEPNATVTYTAYSWAHVLSDGTDVVDLHLASSADGGATWTYVGPLYQSHVVTQSQSTAYAATNDTSTETVDLIPVPLTGSSAGQTLWVQAHQSYLVQPQQQIYSQINATDVISVSAVQIASPAAAGAGTLLEGFASAPEARLAGYGPDSSLNVTARLSSLATAASKCVYFGQPALWYDAPSAKLYMALECVEAGSADGNDFAHFLYATTPTGTDASKWTWSYVGELATIADAEHLSQVEQGNTTAYTFFTEPVFAMNKAGTQLLMILTPAVLNPTGQQPVIQYGCRAVPVTNLASATLDIDPTTKAPVSVATITEKDLYSGVDEGPAACTYEPASKNGVVMGRKYENDASSPFGFYLYPLATGIFP